MTVAHKYIARKPKAGGGYTYIYAESSEGHGHGTVPQLGPGGDLRPGDPFMHTGPTGVQPVTFQRYTGSGGPGTGYPAVVEVKTMDGKTIHTYERSLRHPESDDPHPHVEPAPVPGATSSPKPHGKGTLRTGAPIGDSFRVVGVTSNAVKIRLNSGRGKDLTFRWDGTGYIRQGQYLADNENGTIDRGEVKKAASTVSEEIRHLIRDKGYPQKQAVAAALEMQRRGKISKSLSPYEIVDMVKAASGGHQYVKRYGTPGNYRYVYAHEESHPHGKLQREVHSKLLDVENTGGKVQPQHIPEMKTAVDHILASARHGMTPGQKGEALKVLQSVRDQARATAKKLEQHRQKTGGSDEDMSRMHAHTLAVRDIRDTADNLYSQLKKYQPVKKGADMIINLNKAEIKKSEDGMSRINPLDVAAGRQSGELLKAVEQDQADEPVKKSEEDPLAVLHGRPLPVGSQIQMGSVRYTNPGAYVAKSETSAPGLQPLRPIPGSRVTDDSIVRFSRVGGHIVPPDSGLRRDDDK